MRTTYADLQSSRIPAVLGVCPTDAKLLAWTNEAQQRLLVEGRWWGTTARFRICATNGCITLPPQIATIEAVNVCGMPTPIRDQWWEFLEAGPGSVSGNNSSGCSIAGVTPCMNNAVSRGRFCSFDDVHGPGKKLKFICDVVSDVNKTVLALGYDDNNNWIRTSQNGVIADGEVVSLAQGSGTLTVNNFSVVTDLQFNNDRDGTVWMYEYDTVTTNIRLIGQYSYYENRPSYARYFFPSIIPQSNSSGGCSQIPVEIIGKLDFVPVRVPTDYLIISNLPAMKEMMVAIRNAENATDGVQANAIIQAGLTIAKSILDSELDNYLGAGRRIGINILGSSIGRVDPVQNFV